MYMQRLGLICITFLFSTLLFGGNNLKIELLEPASMLVNARTNANLPYKHNNTLYLVGYSNSVATVIGEAKKRGVVIDGLAGGGYFYFSVPAEKLQTVLSLPGLQKIGYLSPLSKTSDFLTGDTELAEVFKNGQSLKLKIYFSKGISASTIKNTLESQGILPTVIDENFSYFTLRGDHRDAEKLASLPYVRYIGLEASGEAFPLLNTAFSLNRTNKALATAPNGLGLSGRGINVAVIDGGYVGPHIDFERRVTHVERLNIGSFNSQHGTHVTGALTGAGHRNPAYRGVAPKATVYEWNYTDDYINKMLQGINQYNTMISNNSYYLSEYGIFCGRSAEYVPESQDLDQLSVLYPSYLPVIASGNSGNICSGYGNMPVGIQGAKNNITVGRCDDNALVDAGSSKGPTMDGRLKPELVAEGIVVTSTFPIHNYGTFTGTSMSAPQVTGAIALIYQAYKALFGVLPPAMLAKALLCNTAADLGLPGPDFTNGYGRMDIYKAVKALQNNQYFTSAVGHGDSVTFTFNVPANTASTRVMLSWTDVPATLPYDKILINDLDMYVQTPGGDILPLVADAFNPTLPAVPGKDSLNNLEQVLLTSPTAGTYTIVVKGKDVPLGPQSFAVVYQSDSIGIDISYPDGGESLLPGVNPIRWDANGITGKVTIEYSDNGGSSWTLITDTVNASQNYYFWNVPNIATEQALIKISGNGKTGISGNTFTIMPNVTNLVYTPCDRGTKMTWTLNPFATEYLIYMFTLNDTAWKQIGSTTGNEFWVNNMQPGGATLYLSVVSKNGTMLSQRTLGFAFLTNVYNACPATNDAGTYLLTSPAGGRRFTSSALTASETIRCMLKNFGTNTIKNFNVSYSVNGGVPVTQLFADSLTTGDTGIITFTTPFNFSAVGDYDVKIWTSLAGDLYPGNDTLRQKVRHLPNNPVTLPYKQDFDALTTSDFYLLKYVGLHGLDPFDLQSDSMRARARTAIIDLYSNSKPNGITVDNMGGTGVQPITTELMMTLNLSNYVDSIIYLDFSYMNHGEPFGGDSVLIRGSDTSPWIKVFDLFANKIVAGFYQNVTGINMSKVLFSNGQNFSSSTQVKFSILTDRSANQYERQGGYSFDDIKVYNAGKDISVTKNDTIISFCSGQYVLDVTVSNHTATPVSNVPVYYTVNGGTPVKDTVTSTVPANSSITFSFTVPAVKNADPAGKYTLIAWSEQPEDIFKNNDTTLSIDVLKLNTIATAPGAEDTYTQDFEEDNGAWISVGDLNTWTWGAPEKYDMPRAGMGTNSWVNTLTRDYLNGEHSYLYTPCMPSPVANTSLSYLSQLEIERTFDSIYLEYSYDGANWNRLGAYNDGYNWYNASDSSNYWDNNISPWQVSSLFTLPTDVTSRPLMLRWLLMADGYTTYEGQGIDNVFYDNLGGLTPSNPGEVTESVSSTELTPYYLIGSDIEDTVLAEIKTFGGSASVKVSTIIAADKPVADYHEHFLLNTRWFVDILSGTPDSVLVRLFFSDSMFQNLLTYDDQLPALSSLRLVKYNGIAQDTSLINDHFSEGYRVYSEGEFNIWPFKNGYFVEFVTDSPGEFWLQNGSPNDSAYNSTRFSSFTAKRNDDKAVLDWQTIQEIENSRFRLEYSTDGFNYQLLDSVPGGGRLEAGSRDYQYIDSISSKSNIMYYRLSQVDSSDRVYYAGVDTADFTDTPVEDQLFNTSWQFNGLWLDIDKNISENVEVTIFNAAGALLDIYKTNIQKGRNYIGKSYMSGWPAGTYIVRITSDKLSGSSRFVKSN